MKRNELPFSKVFCLLLLLTLCAELIAHGTVTSPPSRVWNCYQENPENPTSAACIDAVNMYGSQPLYDWNAISQGTANGNHMQVVEDGNLASGGDPGKYGGMDQVRSDWVKTDVSAGDYTVTWTNSAPHATQYYDVYITTEDWTADQPLSWDKLTLLVRTDPSPAESTVDIPVVLPPRTGHHVIYSVWQRSDSPEAFYSASDVDFGNGGGGGGPLADKKVVVSDDLEVLQNVFLPGLANGENQSLGIDASGKIVEMEKHPNNYNRYDFAQEEIFQGYKVTRKGLYLTDSTILDGVDAFLLDNNPSSGNENNSAIVNIIRQNKLTNNQPPELIFQLTSEETANGAFMLQSNNSVVTAGSNVIDNDYYIYAIEVYYCDACEFREIILTE